MPKNCLGYDVEKHPMYLKDSKREVDATDVVDTLTAPLDWEEELRKILVWLP